jgi:hypothetical protein
MPRLAQRGRGSIAPTACNSALEGGEWSATCSGRSILGKEPMPLVQEASGWVGLEAGLDGTENLVSIGILSPDRPTRSE